MQKIDLKWVSVSDEDEAITSEEETKANTGISLLLRAAGVSKPDNRAKTAVRKPRLGGLIPNILKSHVELTLEQ